ncbi:helix-turn-helix domain-containing protein [Actinoplanes sp. NPDC049316]|uniref:helix-turn-helix domain-containing protein n=1 Tax=Actinoplanes sp. NPDC049316 TaxID=3154727 RepID=UPI003437D8D4
MYAEWPSTLPHVIAWRSTVPPGTPPKRILPDGCLDVIWQDGRVFVAGPDTTAQLAAVPPHSRLFAVRFADGVGPSVLGVPADELTDRRVPFDALFSPAETRRLAEAGDPLAALEAFTLRRRHRPDRAMVALAAGARAGAPIGAIAESCGLSARHLHRRCTAAFGYGPKTLAKIMRMQRAVAMARRGRPFADVSVAAGYADQAHLARDVRALAGVPLSRLVR